MNPTLLALVNGQHEVKLVIDGVSIPIQIGAKSAIAAIENHELASPNTFRPENGRFHIQFNGKVLTRRKSVGLGCIHGLLKQPNANIYASALWTAQKGEIVGCKSEKEFTDEGYKELGLHVQSDRGEALVPGHVLRQARNTLREMEEDLASLKASGEQALAFEKEQEIEKVQEYLRQASFRGHEKRSSDGYEKARKRVSVGIARAIADLQTEHPALARHLDNSIHTGQNCRYSPETDVNWIL